MAVDTAYQGLAVDANDTPVITLSNLHLVHNAYEQYKLLADIATCWLSLCLDREQEQNHGICTTVWFSKDKIVPNKIQYQCS